MKAKRLPSGSYNVTVYSHTENGKRKYISVTAPTKALAELRASELKATKKRRMRSNITVLDAVNGYISAKEGVLSPSTIRGYVRMRDHNIEEIAQKRVNNLTSEDLQIFVSNLSSELSPKTVRNVYGLVSASLALYAPDMSFRVTLPAKQIKRPVSPSDDDIRALYKSAYPTLRICIGLAMCGLRRGEICAVRYEDIDGTMLHVHADMVKDQHGNWLYKDRTKTPDGDRYVQLPQFVLDDIGTGTGYVADIQPDTLSKQFIKYRDRLGINIRLHDIRHYFASSAALIMPDTYLADMGGWSRSGAAPTMKSVYKNNIKSMSEHYQKKYAKKLDKVIGDA